MDKIARVHIVEDDAAYLDSLASLVNVLGFPISRYESAQDYLDRGTSEPGCLILDLHMPGRDGAAVLEHLSKLHIAHPVIVLTGRASVSNVVTAYQSGQVVAFLQKQLLNEVGLLEAIQQGLAKDLEQRLQFERTQSLKQAFQTLTRAEVDVLNRILQGHDHATISNDLKVSRRTVENRRAKVMQKLNVENLPSLMQIVMEIGYFRRDSG